MKLWKKCLACIFALSLSVSCATMAACGKDGNENNDGTNNEQDDIIEYKKFKSGAGGEYNRFEGEEGYYEIELKAGASRWYSFAPSCSGEYALVTLEAKEGVTIERYNAEAHYINPQAYPATEQEDGTLISQVTCTELYFSGQWRATYKITSTVNGTLKIRFVRLGDAPPDPKYHTTKVTAKEIAGIAPDADEFYTKKEVPWLEKDNPSYFYDENYEITFTDLTTGRETTATGFYRYGREGDANAPVIWAAISSGSSRYLEGQTFSTIQYPGRNLCVVTGTVPSSHPDVTDYLENNYVDFILNNGGLTIYNPETKKDEPAPGDEKMLCYMNVTNSDGLFPVNQELFEFLNYYTAQNPPFIDDGVNIAKENYWLAPCYYYAPIVQGTEDNPTILNAGITFLQASMTDLYYKIESDTATKFTIVGDPGLMIYVNGTNYGTDGNGFTITLDVPVGGITFVLKARTEANYSITVTEVLDETDNTGDNA